MERHLAALTGAVHNYRQARALRSAIRHRLGVFQESAEGKHSGCAGGAAVPGQVERIDRRPKVSAHMLGEHVVAPAMASGAVHQQQDIVRIGIVVPTHEDTSAAGGHGDRVFGHRRYSLCITHTQIVDRRGNDFFFGVEVVVQQALLRLPALAAFDSSMTLYGSVGTKHCNVACIIGRQPSPAAAERLPPPRLKPSAPLATVGTVQAARSVRHAIGESAGADQMSLSAAATIPLVRVNNPRRTFTTGPR